MPLFHPQHVQAVADRLGNGNWGYLQTEAFREQLEGLKRRRLTGEANTREKVIDPILYEVLGFDHTENDAEHAVKHAGAGGETGAVEYYFLIPDNPVLVEAKSWGKPLDEKGPSGRSPVRARVRVCCPLEPPMVHRHQRGGMAPLQDATQGKPKSAGGL